MKTTRTNSPTSLQKLLSSPQTLACAAALFTLAATYSQAATLNWTGTTDGDWNDASNWGGSGTPADGDDLIFSGTSNTATNNDVGVWFVTGIQFANTTAGESFSLFSLGGNRLNWNGTISTAAVVGGGSITDTISLELRATSTTRNFDLGADHHIDVTGKIWGPQGIRKLGDGTLTLSGANDYTGSSTVSAGTLKVQSQTALGTTGNATTVADGATLELNYVPPTNADPIAENITLNGAGVGGTEGALKVTATGPGSELNSTVTLGSDATINNTVRFDHSGTVTDGANSFTLTKKGAGQHRAVFHADFAHLVIAEGEYELASNLALPSDTVTVNSGARLDIWRSLDLTQAGHTPTITFNDGSKFNWRGNNLNDEASIGGAMVLNGTVDFEVGGGNGKQITVESDISGTGNLNFTRLASNSGTMILTGANSYSGNTTINSGVLEIGGAGTLGSGSYAGAISFTGNATLDYNTSADQTLSGNITGAGNFQQNGSGTTTLSGANTYTGATTVSAGTLRIQSQTALGTTAGATTVADGSTLELNYGPANNSSPIEENITLNGAGVGGTEGALKITGTGPGNELGNNTITLGSDATINTQARFDTNSTITDNGNGYTLTKTGSNYSHFMNASGVTADFTHLVIAEGDYWAGSNALPGGVGTSVTVANGAQLTTWGAQVIANSPDITFEGGSTFRTDRANDTMSINGTMTLNGAVTFSGPQATHTANISSDIGGTGSLTKTGPNTTNLSGNNTYTGTTTVSAGTLALSAADNNIASSAEIDVASGATLDVSGVTNGFAVASGQTLSGTGSVVGGTTVGTGAILSPGNSPGTQTFDNLTWTNGGTYLWEINADAANGGTQGADPGWDWISVTSTFDLSGITTGFDIDITSLTNPGNVAGLADGFDPTGKSYLDAYESFTILSFGTLTGTFDASLFNLDDSGFSNPKVGWSLELSGNDLVLNAVFVPEPSSTALLGLGLSALMLRRKRS